MKIAVIGGGSWGSTLANVLSDNGHETLIYDINEMAVNDINFTHKHPFFDTYLNDDIKATTNIKEALDFADNLLISVPTKVMRNVLVQINQLINTPKTFINVSKGIEPETLLTVSQIAYEVIDNNLIAGFVTLSGPSHAEEVILRKLTTLVAASKNEERAKFVQNLFSNREYMRVYTSNDILGVEVGGSVKNAIALISGISAGLGMGENARAALISRGAIEIAKITEVMGGSKDTVFGLAGIGDLIVTASSLNSRNFQAGLKIGKGENIDDVVKNSRMVVEGARVIISAKEIAEKYNLELPIIQTAYNVLYENKPVKEMLAYLLQRDLKAE